MPRRRPPPRLYLDKKRGTWSIRDGAHTIRTGFGQEDVRSAEKRLIEYLGEQHRQWNGPATDDPLIANILQAYASEHLPNITTVKQASYHMVDLLEWWGEKKLSAVTSKACQEYARGKRRLWARRNLEALRAAINHWHREHGPLPRVPAVWMPRKGESRKRWLTEDEAARLLRAARRTPHLARFILLGLRTGSRPQVLVSLRWDWINFEGSVMERRAPGTTESKQKRTPPAKLGRKLLAHLKRWRRLDGPHCTHVCHYNGQPISRPPYTAFRAAAKRAGLGRDVTPHVFRHTRATWGMQRNIPPWQLAGHLGMDLQTLLKVYAKHSPDYQKEAAEF